jgi:hypothetical protein
MGEPGQFIVERAELAKVFGKYIPRLTPQDSKNRRVTPEAIHDFGGLLAARVFEAMEIETTASTQWQGGKVVRLVQNVPTALDGRGDEVRDEIADGRLPWLPELWLQADLPDSMLMG